MGRRSWSKVTLAQQRMDAVTPGWSCACDCIYCGAIKGAVIQSDLFAWAAEQVPAVAAESAPPPFAVEPVRAAPELRLQSSGAGETSPSVVYERSARARHYRLTLRRDGVAVATIPARGSERAARDFVAGQAEWLDRARERQRQRPRLAEVWTVGTELMWRGAMTELRPAAVAGLAGPARVCLAADVFRVPRLTGDLRPTLEAAFLRVAKIELTARTWELAAETKMAVTRVVVRNQRTRWGSCTTGGVISLNWRLIQAPVLVSDYIILHELMHLREMNHSARFWRAVEAVFPRWREAETWLKEHGGLLGL